VLGVTKDAGLPGLVLLDENGKQRAMLNVEELGTGLGLFDKNSKTRVGLFAEDKIGSYLNLGKTGKVIWKAP